MNKPKARYEVLDAWRGVCACIIVLYHGGRGHLGDLVFFKNSYLAVDFFFVLSGFVIALNYQEKLLKKFPLKNFVWLRLGRLYPLHLVMLLCFLVMELLKFVVPLDEPPFANEHKSFESFIGHLFLVQGMGLFNVSTWNSPSWSISVEFFTYIGFALYILLMKDRVWIGAMVFLIFCLFLLPFTGHADMDMSYDYGFLRCVYGFSGGVVLYYLLVQRKPFMLSKRAADFWEPTCVIAIILFVVYCGRNEISFLAPFLFMLCVSIFSFEAGWLSRILKHRAFLLLGTLSFSIYMTHRFILFCQDNAVKIFARLSGTDLYLMSEKSAFVGDVIDLIFFIVVLAISYGTYHLIEKPANEWCRQHVKKKQAIKVPNGSATAF